MFSSIEYFKDEVKSDLAKVNDIIRSQIKSDVFLINQVGEYIVGSGGKRLRPIVTMLSGKALGFDEQILQTEAAMVEFIHTSTLLHDDVVDESELRRGRRTANHEFGNAAAVLVGDFLYTRAFQLMVKSGKMRLMRIMSDATNVIASGEVMQLVNIGNVDLAMEDYRKVIGAKTAKLFEAACQVAAVLADADEELEFALRDYGLHMGTSFQIVDDVLDYLGETDETGKRLGDDLGEGKVTLPLIHLLRAGDSECERVVVDAITHPERADLDAILELMVKHGTREYCRQEAAKDAELAIRALKPLPKNRYSDTLAKMVEVYLDRMGG